MQLRPSKPGCNKQEYTHEDFSLRNINDWLKNHSLRVTHIGKYIFGILAKQITRIETMFYIPT